MTYNKSSAKDRPCKAEGRNIFIRSSFVWVNELIAQAYKQPLRQSDVDSLPLNMLSGHHLRQLNDAWIHHISAGSKYPLLRSLISAFWERYHVTMFLIKWLVVVLVFVRPLLLQLLLRSLDNRSVDTGSLDFYWPYVLALLLAVGSMSQAFVTHWYFWQGVQCALSIRGGLVGIIQSKVVKMHASVTNRYPAGVIMNLASSDADSIMSFFWNSVHEVWASPVIIVVSLVWLFFLLGYSALIGCLVMVLSVAFNAGFISKAKSKIQKLLVSLSDRRINHIAEFVSNVKLIKLYNWEDYFSIRILKSRARQNVLLAKISRFTTLSRFLGNITPNIVTLVTFAIYTGIFYNQLGATKVFTALMLFNNLKEPLSKFPEATNLLMRTVISLSRIESFLKEQEKAHIETRFVQPAPAKYAFELRNVSAGWSKTASPILRNISFKIPTGSLIFIVGPVGCGKSSLLETLLQETFLIDGEFSGTTDIAFCNQSSWIQTDTIRNNVLFGKKFNLLQYLSAIKSCALVKDFENLPNGDASLIGDQDGVQLSGGQRQRLNLARAVYQNKGAYLLDEPLSAVDAHVAKWLFEHVLGRQGLLKKKTRILVTHRIQFAKEADLIVVMRDGQVNAIGSYKDLKQRGVDLVQVVKPMETDDTIPVSLSKIDDINEAVARVDTAFRRSSQDTEKDNISIIENDMADANRSVMTSLASLFPADGENSVKEEMPESSGATEAQNDVIRVQGATKSTIYLQYFFSASSYKYWAVTALIVLVSQACIVLSEIYLAKWTSGVLQDSLLRIIINYTCLVAAASVLFIFRCRMIGNGTCSSSFALHDSMFYGISNAKLAFFDTHSMGRIVSRFSRDIELVDKDLPEVILDVASCFITSLGTVAMIFYVTPIAIPFTIPVFLLYFSIQKYYRPASRDLKRLESSFRSPIYTYLNESISGIFLVRAVGNSDYFINTLLSKIDENVRFYFYSFAVNRWLGTRLEVVGGLLVLAASIGALAWQDFLPQSDTSGGSWIALGITTAVAISGNLNWMVRQLSDLEVQMNAVERICEFSEEPSEEPDITGDTDTQMKHSKEDRKLLDLAKKRSRQVCRVSQDIKKKGTSRPEMQLRKKSEWKNLADSQTELKDTDELIDPPIVMTELAAHQEYNIPDSWPNTGRVTAANLGIRYRTNLPLTVKNVSFSIMAGEKVGVVGRTGAGKSTIAMALFRCVPIEKMTTASTKLLLDASAPLAIDGVDIMKIPLRRLRRSLGIIPQEPVIFSGSMRFNLDPSGSYEDQRLWEALDKVQLKEWCISIGGLDKYISGVEGEDDQHTESSLSLSVGQRQLVCLARVILKRPKLIVMDEATASLDYASDAHIKNLLRKEFHAKSAASAGTTIFSIAHRLDTILDSDKIMVFDSGSLVEFGPPAELIKNPNGYFTHLMQSEEKQMAAVDL